MKEVFPPGKKKKDEGEMKDSMLRGRGLRTAFCLAATIIVEISNDFDNKMDFTSHDGWVLIDLT